VRERWFEDPGWKVVQRSFLIAAETGERARPIYLLVAISELDSPVGSLLAGGDEPFYERAPAAPPAVNGGGGSYLLSQTQQAARQWAADEALRPEHLLVAIVDQANPEALAALARAELEAGAVRSATLGLIGVSIDLPPLAIPPLTPAGTVDRPPLAVEALDPRAWQVLTWRQEHLPLDRVRRVGDWHALSSLERRAAWRVADRLRLDDDQRFSLYAQHHEAVETLAHAAHPELVETRERLRERGPQTGWLRRRRSRWVRLAPNFMVGWPTWFANRRFGVAKPPVPAPHLVLLSRSASAGIVTVSAANGNLLARGSPAAITQPG
jgi:hypothetical protein